MSVIEFILLDLHKRQWESVESEDERWLTGRRITRTGKASPPIFDRTKLEVYRGHLHQALRNYQQARSERTRNQESARVWIRHTCQLRPMREFLLDRSLSDSGFLRQPRQMLCFRPNASLDIFTRTKTTVETALNLLSKQTRK